MIDPYSKVWSEEGYAKIDVGIRFAVRVLHAAGFDTCQSCQGGIGHPYPEPTVDMIAGAADAIGFGAVNALREYDLPVCAVALVWSISGGVPYEKNWRVTFSRAMEERADEKPIFTHSIRPTLLDQLETDMSDDEITHQTALVNAEHGGDLHIEKIAKAICLMFNGCMGPDEWKSYRLMANRFNRAYCNLK